MRAQVLTIALVAALIALPVPASQLLSGAPSASGQPAAAPATLRVLLEDPFLIDRMSFEAPKSFLELDRPAL